MSSSNNDSIKLPTEYTSALGVYMGIKTIHDTVKRASDQMFAFDRGSMEYDGITDSYVCHLSLNDADRGAVFPFLKDVEDIWLVIDAHTSPVEGWEI